MSSSLPFDAASVSLSADEVSRVAVDGAYNLVPLFVDVSADLATPVSAYLRVRSSAPAASFLLESVEGGERQARYSFIGTDPYRVLRQSGADPLSEVERELTRFEVMPAPGLPDFCGGGVGYVGYDCVQYFEPTVRLSDADPLGLPESVFLFCTQLVVFDHLKHTMKVVAHVRLDGADRPGGKDEVDAWARRQYAAAVDSIAAMVRRLGRDLPASASAAPADLSRAGEPPEEFESNVGAAGYESFVSTLKRHIREGDIIQAVPSQRMSRRLRHVRAFDVYRKLRVVNPSPYMFFLDFGDFEVVGASPEQLVRVDGGRVTTVPIAGTRRRGADPEEDERLAAELLACEKERAEHVMLVDLGRNDVGRVSEPGSVRVDSLMRIERYSHVMHIVSNVSGRLAAGRSPYDAFRAVFPAGTVSGAPKIRAMQLVGGLEAQRRGVYGGAVGYIGFGRGAILDTCIAIRTMVVKEGRAYLQAGGGIVFDSEEKAEQQETVNKMMALARAVDIAEEAAVSEARLLAAATADHPDDDAARATSMKQYAMPLAGLDGNFGRFGGRYVPETLVAALDEVEREYVRAVSDPSFGEELRALQKAYVGRPTPVYLARRLTEHCGGARIWLKREDLAHTGAHKINNGLGQGLLARRMGKQRIICETGAGQHGVATATACALLGLDCTVYMGEEDVNRQSLNVFRMKMLGARVVPVLSGTRTLKDAVNEAMRDWVANVRDTYFLIGSAIGPHPFPTIVRDFQCCLGLEVRRQMVEAAGRLPDVAVACVGGGSNAIGLFHPLADTRVELFGVEAAGHGIASGQHAATMVGGSSGVLHGTRTFLLQDDNGQVTPTHSISAGLDYPGIGPEHAHLADTGRVKYVPVTDKEALQGLQDLTRLEGIIPALEPAHAVFWAMKKAATMRADQDLLINMCGRGDKDMIQVAGALGVELFEQKKKGGGGGGKEEAE